MAYKYIKSYTATDKIYPKTVFVKDGKVLGVVDDVDNVDYYEDGDEVPVVVDGIVKLSAITYAYNGSAWVKTPAKEGDVLFYDSADENVKIDDAGQARPNEIIGKVLRVLGNNLYEIKVGL